MTQEKLVELLHSMSLKEKVNQMLQVTTGFFTDEKMLTGPTAQGEIGEENISQAGSLIGLFGAEEYRKQQKAFMEKHPHHIPFLDMLDVINGFRTIYPIPLGQGATFNPDLMKKCASMAALEASVSGIHVTFSPMVDLVRDARWGRVMESTGEDPMLNCEFARAQVEGYQGRDVKEAGKIAACVKHFAGYGAPVGGREYNTVELSENTLMEYYLPAYQAAIEAGAEMVMTSFNTLNGIPSTGNQWLMQEILRGKMGFQGVLISDWAAIEELCIHGFAADRWEAASLAAHAGVDIDMMTGVYCSKLPELVETQVLSEKLLDEAVLRILTLKNKLGLFENPYKDADPEKEKEVILCEEHRKLAREAAEQSFVLLKNEEMLPLNPEEKIAIIGPFAEEKEIYGSWSIIAQAQDTVSIADAVRTQTEFPHVSIAKGCEILSPKEYCLVTQAEAEKIQQRVEQQDRTQSSKALWKEAVKTARKADKVILTLGEHKNMSGEAASRADLRIPKIQRKLLKEIYQMNPNITVILFTGRPLDLRQIEKYAKAILVVWMPGTEGGNAIWNVITGAVSPSGRLPMSFPYCVGQVPISYNEYVTGRPCEDSSVSREYRSNYRDIPNEPLYPFGYGLSYTQFLYSKLSLSSTVLKPGEKLEASIVLRNIGDREGTETVQLYIRDCAGSVVRPKKELKAYQKITLAPDEEITVRFEITEEMLRFYRADGSYGSEKGIMGVMIGKDSNIRESAAFELQ